MKPVRLSLALAVLLPALPAAAQSWIELGGSATGGGISASPAEASIAPSLALDPQGRPVVAWEEQGGTAATRQILLKHWDGATWTSMSGALPFDTLAAGNDAQHPSLAIDAAGVPHVAWCQKSGTKFQIYLKRWDAATSAWVEIGGSATGGGISNGVQHAGQPSLAIDANGHAVVAWINNSEGIHLRRWNPSIPRWEEIGGSVTGKGVSALPPPAATWAPYNPQVRIDGANRPVVLWSGLDPYIYYSLWLRRWDPVLGWTGLGGSDGPTGLSQYADVVYHHSLAIAPNGEPALAWSSYDDAGSGTIRQLSWNGTAWTGPAGSPNPIALTWPALTSGLSLALDNGSAPIIAWSETSGSSSVDFKVRRWNGLAWSLVGGSEIGSPTGRWPSMVYGAALDLFVAWSDSGQPEEEILLKGIPNTAPDPAGHAQFRLDGVTPIPPGGATQGETGFVAVLSATDLQGESFTAEIELRPVGTPMTDPPAVSASAASFQGPTATVTVSGLTLGTAYTWRARTVDASQKASAWVGFNSDDPFVTDLVARTNVAPTGTWTGPTQAGTGATVTPSTPLFSTEILLCRLTVDDLDGDSAKLEFEYAPVATGLQGVPTAAGDLVPPGSVSSVALTLGAPGDYVYAWRAVDSLGLAGPWIAGGATPDFSVEAMGSIGGKPCSQSAGAAAWPLALLLIAIRRRARRGA